MPSVGTMSILVQDLRYALRQLRNSPGFAAAAVLTLALGIGANTAVFSVVNTVLLKPLPYAAPDRLVTVRALNTRGAPIPGSLSYPDFFDLRARNHSFQHLVTGRDTNMVLTGAGEPQQLDGEMVTWDLFPALGIQPQLGRGFLQSEEAPGGTFEPTFRAHGIRHAGLLLDGRHSTDRRATLHPA
jgi:MacB-like periplasmic core domain